MGIVIACDTMRPSSRPMLHSYQGAEGDHVSYDWPVDVRHDPDAAGRAIKVLMAIKVLVAQIATLCHF